MNKAVRLLKNGIKRIELRNEFTYYVYNKEDIDAIIKLLERYQLKRKEK